jgi:hypothetical protein
VTSAPVDKLCELMTMVITDGRRRGAISLVAVLRQVRTALDPGYATMRARLAAFPLVPS